MRFQINIYRPGKKPKKVPKPEAEERRISVAILIPLLFLLLLGISFGYMKASSSLDRKMGMNRKNKTYLFGELKRLDEELKKAQEEWSLISKLRVKRIEWSQKLLDLSKAVPDDLWLTNLSIKTVEKRKKGSREAEEETYLTVKGVTVLSIKTVEKREKGSRVKRVEWSQMPGREPLHSIAQLITSMNSLDSFQRDFEPAKLVYTRVSRKKDRELMEFEVSSKLKDGPGGKGEKASK